MSSRRATDVSEAPTSSSNGKGMFKNLFAPKPEFPLKDERPPQHLRAVAPLGMPVGAPRAPEPPRSFELVGTLTPFEMIEDEDRVALEAATPEVVAAAEAAARAEAARVEAEAEAEAEAAEAAAEVGTGDDDADDARKRMFQQIIQDQTRPPPPAQPPQQHPLANGVVFSLRIRRIRDGETLAAMETTIRAYTERKMKELTAMDPNSQQVWDTSVQYASHSYKYSCLPEEKVLLWASKDKPSYDLLTKMILFKGGWGSGPSDALNMSPLQAIPSAPSAPSAPSTVALSLDELSIHPTVTGMMKEPSNFLKTARASAAKGAKARRARENDSSPPMAPPPMAPPPMAPMTPMERFFTMDLFGKYNSTFPLTASGNTVPMPNEADEVLYKHTKSYQTKWNLLFKFKYPSTRGETNVGMLSESIPVFAASEFTLESEPPGEQSALRRRYG